MADQKLSALTAASGAAESDDLYIVTDTSTTPVSKKITFDNLQNSFTDISLDSAQFDLANTTLPAEGAVAYNATDANLKLGLTGGNVRVALGQELVLPKRVLNLSGTTMTKGTVVYISGHLATVPVVSRAIATSAATSAFTIGLVAENINNNSRGWVVTTGVISGVNLSSFTEGDTLYLSGTTAGEFTSTKPSAPLHMVRIGTVTKATASGELIVIIQNGYELQELHNVSIIGVANGDLIQYESSTSLWKNVPLSTVNGNYLKLDLTNTPLTGNTLNFNGTANKAVNVDRTLTAATAGRSLTVTAGGAVSGGTNLAGGNLVLQSGIATGSGSSDIQFWTTTAGSSGTTDRTQTQKMVIKASGNVGIGTNSPTYPLQVQGTIYSSSEITAAGNVTGLNLSGTNTGDQILPVYGDGSDGAITFDGSTIYTFATLNGSTYTLTRDIFATTITVDILITVITGGYRVFAQNSLTVNGELHNNGSAGSGTTAGAGGLGGFFKAGGAGAAGLGTGSAGAVGTAQATPTANTWVGGLGGKGAMGRASNTTFTGGMITSANVTVPADADGGNKVPSNFVNYLTRYVVGATNWQMTPSIGGGSGAKSATGTTATSGAGGGGGGICFVASPVITGGGVISANGGAGGDAAGTNGNFGGGGGGGGGVMCMIAKTSDITPSAVGGGGGISVIGTNGTLPIATAQGTVTTATQTMTLTPTVPLTKGNLYMVTFHLQKTGGIGGSGINSMSGFGILWTNANLRNTFNSIASPNRVIEIWYGYYQGIEPDVTDDETITVELSDLNTSARVIIDEIQNTDASFSTNPIVGNNAINQVDSATTLTVTLPVAPTTGNLVYSVFARSAGTATTAGAGNTLVNNQTTAPQISSQVSSAQQANTQTHTTAAAVAGISMEIAKSVNGANGSNGWDGKVVRIYG
jgi:hypothetical protein